MLLLGLAIAPGLAICIYIYWRDKFEKEPRKLLALCFLLGLISVIPTVILEAIAGKIDFNLDSLPGLFLYAWLGVGIIEEACKYFFVRLIPYRSNSFNEAFDGITYSVMVSMGFATLENIMYVFKYGYVTGFWRMFTAVPAHAAFGIIIGYYLGIQKMNGVKYAGLWGLLLAATLHAAYDFFLFANNIPGMWFGALASLLLGIYFSLKAIKLHQLASPFQANNSVLK